MAGLGRRNTFEFDGMQNKYKKQKSLPSNWDLNQIQVSECFFGWNPHNPAAVPADDAY